MELKKIVLLTPAHPLRGGIAASSERLALELNHLGYEVVVVSFRLQYPNFLFPGATQFTDDPPPENVRIETRLNSVNPFNWLMTGLYLKKLCPDLLIIRYWLPFMGPSLGTVARIARSNKKTKVIALADNIIPHEKRPGDVLFTRYFCKSVNGFLVMSRSVGEDAGRFAPQKPVVYSPHPIFDNYGPIVSRKEALEQLQLSKEVRYLLFFGFIRDYKGLDLLLEAIRDERIKALPVKLIIAGEFYGDKEKYLQLIQKFDLQDKVVLHNHFIPNEQVKYYFGASDLVVQPYKSATQSGISQLAYHFETPMVVTRVGGLPEIVENGKVGYVVEVNAAAVAEAVLDFFEKENLDKMTQGVRENKGLFMWDKMVMALVDLFGRL
ncbi:MAG: glycosyltransferase [Saprospiraceae bacterium]|nr:glycosyltransferase [Saprospiraceae bacterium]MCB9325764.1 glycosyltransferase [Lewinellaceae bacterium]